MINLNISNAPTALFDPATSRCDDCNAPAIANFDIIDDEYSAALCAFHMTLATTRYLADMIDAADNSPEFPTFS